MFFALQRVRFVVRWDTVIKMALLNLSKIEKWFGDRPLFTDVSFEIAEHDKVGFVGVNGAGKTTLFRLLLGELSPDGGTIFQNKLTHIGYLEQHAELTSQRTVWEELMTVFVDVIALEEELSDIAYDISRGAGDPVQLAERQHALSEEFERRDGFTYQARAKAALLGLGFAEADLSLPFSALSGGQKTRVLLCKILLSSANLLLLDEPTNHLDIASVEWLEGFLRDYRGAFIVISHDRYFLDRVTNRTLELENGHLVAYRGGYTEYLRQKEENRLALTRKYDNTMREIKRIEGIIAQQRQWNRERNIKTAESKQKMIDRLEAGLERPEETPAGIRFAFRTRPGGAKDVLRAEGLSMAFGDKRLFSGLDLHVTRGEHVFLLGPNGCGKTTLLKILTRELDAQSGHFQLGANIQAAYYDQAQENLDYSKTVFDEVHDAYPKLTNTEVRNALACFLFRGDDVFKEIGTLSGGERAKVSLVKLMLSCANFLLLDEPTNHLDITSREALEDALADFDGTLLVVSHDRYFINKLAGRVCVMAQNGLTSYLGNYDYYLEKSRLPADAPAAVKEAPSAGRETYQQQKQREADRRKRENQLKRTEAAIEELERTIAELEDALNACGADYVKASELTDQLTEANVRLSALYEQWEQLSAE